MINLLHVLQVLVQNSSTFLFEFFFSAFLHFLADFDLPKAAPSFELHFFFSFEHANFNFLQFPFFDITDGKSFEQPIQKSKTKIRRIFLRLHINQKIYNGSSLSHWKY